MSSAPADMLSVVKTISTSTELLAWAAGLFEGEGSITANDTRLILSVRNGDLEVLEFFEETVQAGTIYGPYTWTSDGARRKPFWTWVAAAEEAFEVLGMLAPWLSSRRLQRAMELTEIDFRERRFAVKRPCDQ